MFWLGNFFCIYFFENVEGIRKQVVYLFSIPLKNINCYILFMLVLHRAIGVVSFLLEHSYPYILGTLNQWNLVFEPKVQLFFLASMLLLL